MSKMLAQTRHFLGAKCSHCQAAPLRQKHVKAARNAEKRGWRSELDGHYAADENWADQYDLPWSERD